MVKDLNSTNGTFINGERVTGEAGLSPGQILRLGQIEMRLETGEPAPKKTTFEHTRVIGGVKAGDFEQGPRPVFDKNSPFSKKSNKTAMIFITIGIVLAVVIVVFLLIAYQKLHG